eukprot:CAMPEP_0168608654 /NCGR_PEP_ID=MMETSP0449_2-20121227/753_1 /TAXON_ID=1082188 /ORGANISM="Strombidium rassoulzadegani, Strain ras09" /LENGTH=150 /DNA_ID=CAMNT_0008648675 /DNA_START=488 /DNA_END=936 /DNA_ORIENTATION=+
MEVSLAQRLQNRAFQGLWPSIHEASHELECFPADRLRHQAVDKEGVWAQRGGEDRVFPPFLCLLRSGGGQYGDGDASGLHKDPFGEGEPFADVQGSHNGDLQEVGGIDVGILHGSETEVPAASDQRPLRCKYLGETGKLEQDRCPMRRRA